MKNPPYAPNDPLWRKIANVIVEIPDRIINWLNGSKVR